MGSGYGPDQRKFIEVCFLRKGKQTVQKSYLALVDCNAFFCSCEKLFRPELKARPVGVLSRNDGCFVSRTTELKALGVPMGGAWFQYREMCQKNKVAVFSSNAEFYKQMSRRVMEVLKMWCRNMEVYSVDEAFLDLKGISLQNLESYGVEIKKAVKKHTGIPVSVGIGLTKTLAKLANTYAKETSLGVQCFVEDGETNKVLDQLDISKVWGLGPQSVEKLKSVHVMTANDFKNFPNTKLLKNMLGSHGLRIQQELQGYSHSTLHIREEPKKSILSSGSFGDQVKDMELLKKALGIYVSRACKKLRMQNSWCKTLQVGIRTSIHLTDAGKMYKTQRSHCFLEPTHDTFEVLRCGIALLENMYRPGFGYKKIWVRLSNIRSVDGMKQHSFFSSDKNISYKSEKLMETMDHINARYKKNALFSGVCTRRKTQKGDIKPRRDFRSRDFLTGWLDLPEVK